MFQVYGDKHWLKKLKIGFVDAKLVQSILYKLSMSTYLHQHTHLPISTFLLTIDNLPTYTNLCQPTYPYQTTSTYLPTYINILTYLWQPTNMYQLSHRFFGNSMRLQMSPILLFWNQNCFLEKRVQKLRRITKKRFYATLSESLIL